MKLLQKKIEKLLIENKIEAAQFEAKEFIKEYGKTLTETEILEKVNKRITGYPLQYIFGNWEFYGLKFLVGEGVLIPRADTEILVDTALSVLKEKENALVVDLCSGTGCVAIAIEKNSNATVTAVEMDKKAFTYLQKNIALNDSNVTAVLGDATKFCGKYDMVVSNPPYIETENLKRLQKEVRFEPKIALDGGKDGLIFYRKITENSKKLLNKNGCLIFEIGYNQEKSVSEILSLEGFSDIRVIKDFGGNPRVIFGTYNSL